MPIPSVETFESDITEEIKQKETTMTDIIAARNISENTVPETQRTFLFIVIFLVLGLIGVFSGAYYLYKKTNPTAISANNTQGSIGVLPSPKQTEALVQLSTALPETSKAIDRYVTTIKKGDTGYVLSITDYQAVYGYLLHNEDIFGTEALSLFNETATDTISFLDVTQSNQDMRVYSSDVGGGIAYGFIGTSTLLIASTPDNLLALRSAILK